MSILTVVIFNKVTTVNLKFDPGGKSCIHGEMNKPVQKRSLATRAKLIESAREIIASDGFSALRVEQVVQNAGVAKGTFFAHFRDKDALMEIIIGAKIDACLDTLESLPQPTTVDTLIGHLMPLIQFMTCERYVFDLIIRHSGAAAKDEIGPVARTFERQITVFAQWFSTGPFRKDVSPVILAEGIQAFAIQSMALDFCSINSEDPVDKRLTKYLDAWLCR